MREATRRKFLQAGLGAAAVFNIAPTRAAPPAIAAPHLQRGVNTWPWFSLTREFPAPSRDYGSPPFQPQRPVPTPSDLRNLKSAGFDFIRLPVDPGPFAALQGPERKALFNALQKAITFAMDAGLSIVLTLMGNSATHYWTPERMYGSTDAPLLDRYLALVGELAQMLAVFDQSRVVLEPANEPPAACGLPDWPLVQNRLLQSARSVAPHLTLMATGACGSLIQGLVALDAKALARFEPLLYTFHFYEPYLFTHQGAPWMQEPVYRDLNNVPWPGSEGSLDQTLQSVRRQMSRDTGRSETDKAAAYLETVTKLKEYFAARPDRPFIKSYFDQISAWAAMQNIAPSRILIGEFGALRTDTHYVAAGAQDRARYIRDVRLEAEAYGFPWAFWNLFDGFALMDEGTRKFDPAILKALGLT